jgi:CHAD domain-containing protein
MLATEERAKLLIFVKKSSPETPYLRRARIVLLADEGATQEAIAAEVQVPITRVRQMLRAYKREGIVLFPESIWSITAYRADEPISGVARQIIFSLAARLEQYEPDLSVETSVTAVHESRKTTRRMRTALDLFEPYFKKRLLRTYRRRARKFMRRLGRSRDIAVFLLKLEEFVVESGDTGRLSEEELLALNGLAVYWQSQQDKADARVRRTLATGKYRRLLDDLLAFGRGDIGKTTPAGDQMPVKARYITPVMLYGKLGRVRATGDQLGELQPERLHALRITCKELRYTLEFFEGMLGPSAGECIDAVKRMLTHLGDVNDARVHLEMLAKMQEPELAEATDLYRSVIEAQLQQLQESFPSLWAELDGQEWRQQLAMSVAVL